MTPQYIMWGIGWKNLMLHLQDLPQYEYGEDSKNRVTVGDELETVEDFEKFLG